jgi:hypothetical protein
MDLVLAQGHYISSRDSILTKAVLDSAISLNPCGSVGLELLSYAHACQVRR